MFKQISELLDSDLPPGRFLIEAGWAVGQRRNELSGNPSLRPVMDLEAVAWQEVHALLLKAILDELVKARKGIRT